MEEPWSIRLIHETLCESVFTELKLVIPFEKRPDAPRYECWMMRDNLAPYTYGRNRGERTYQANIMPDLVKKIGKSVREILGGDREPEGCFANLYRDAHDHLGWHADASDMIDHEYPVVSVSFGDRRRIQFRSNTEQDKVTELWMEPGSITVMPAGFQHTHQHQIPKEGRVIGERVSLTYRWLK